MLHGFAEDDLAYFPNEKSTTWESIRGTCVKLIYILSYITLFLTSYFSIVELVDGLKFFLKKTQPVT